MKKILSCIFIFLMTWTIIDRYFQGDAWSTFPGIYYILENEQGKRRIIFDHYFQDNPLIIGDKVTIEYKEGNWKEKSKYILEKIK